MNVNTLRAQRRFKNIREEIDCSCPMCYSDNVRVLGELDEEITLKCEECGYFFEEIYIGRA